MHVSLVFLFLHFLSTSCFKFAYIRVKEVKSMTAIPLTVEELHEIRVGEAISMTTVTLVFAVVILAIAAYKLFMSGKAKVEIPGGYKFEWSV